MALAAAPGPACPATGEVVTHVYADGRGRIRLCRVPYTCVPWSRDIPIPAGWQEAASQGRDPCPTVVVANPDQLRRAGVSAPAVPRVPRLPRSPRPARARRPPRPPRPPRAARAPRPARPPRPLTGQKEPYDCKRNPKLTCLHNNVFGPCDCYTMDTKLRVWSNWVVGPWAGEEAPCEAPEGCGIGFGGRNACEQQAQAVFGNVQAILGWRRPGVFLPEIEAEAKRQAARDALERARLGIPEGVPLAGRGRPPEPVEEAKPPATYDGKRWFCVYRTNDPLKRYADSVGRYYVEAGELNALRGLSDYLTDFEWPGDKDCPSIRKTRTGWAPVT